MAKEKDIPITPFVLGLILGKSIETYFRQAAVMGFEKIVHHPISIVALVGGLALLVIFQIFKEKVHD